MRGTLCVVILILVAGCTRPADEEATQASAEGADVEVSSEGDAGADASASSANASAQDDAPPAAANETQSTSGNQTGAWNGTWNGTMPTPPTPPGMPSGWGGEGNASGERSTFAKSFDLTLTQAPVVGVPPVVGGGNCIVLTSDNATMLHSGTAIATWGSGTPLADVLALAQRFGGVDEATAEGSSPLALNLTTTVLTPSIPEVAFAPTPAFDGAEILLRLPQAPALALQQEVTVEVTFEYSGGEPDAQVSDCG